MRLAEQDLGRDVGRVDVGARRVGEARHHVVDLHLAVDEVHGARRQLQVEQAAGVQARHGAQQLCDEPELQRP